MCRGPVMRLLFYTLIVMVSSEVEKDSIGGMMQRKLVRKKCSFDVVAMECLAEINSGNAKDEYKLKHFETILQEAMEVVRYMKIIIDTHTKVTKECTAMVAEVLRAAEAYESMIAVTETIGSHEGVFVDIPVDKMLKEVVEVLFKYQELDDKLITEFELPDNRDLKSNLFETLSLLRTRFLNNLES